LTLAEKILAAHTGKKGVSPGELVNVRVDLILANDITAPIAIREFQRIGAKKVFDPEKIVMVPDHFVPNKDIASAEQAKLMREFAREQGTIYFEVGQAGIEHVLLPEQGLVLRRIPIPVPTVRWAFLLPEWGQLILLPLWQPAISG